MEQTEKRRRRSRGKWGPGLSAVTIAELMSCSVWTAKQQLYAIEAPVTSKKIGRMIYEYLDKKEAADLGTYYKSRDRGYWV